MQQNFGARRGQCSHILPDGAAAPVVIRYESDAVSLLTNEDVLAAMKMLQSGTFDVQHVCGFLKHDNVANVNGLIYAYLREKCNLPNEKIPAQFIAQESELRELSKEARLRVDGGVDDQLPVDFVIESCGVWENGDAIVPMELQGRAWRTVKKEIDEELISVLVPTYCTPIEALAARWMRSPGEVEKYVASRSMRPFAHCNVEFNEERKKFSVELLPIDGMDAWANKDEVGDRWFKVLGGHETENADSDYSIVIEVPQSMMNTDARKTRNVATSRGTSGTRRVGLIRRPTFAEEKVKLPLSLVQKCIRRGESLSPPTLLKEALTTLTGQGSDFHVDGKTAQELLVWRVLQSAFSDASPFVPDKGQGRTRRGRYLSIPELLALGLIFQADTDRRFCLPEFLKEALHEVALRLQAKEASEDLWPWKGWAIKYRKKGDKSLLLESCSTGVSDLRNVLRCLIAVDLPISEQERDMYKRYLLVGLAKGAAYEEALEPLKPGQAVYKSSSSLVDKETRLAALDHSVYPAMLAFFQATLPFPPRSMQQHGVKALEQLIYRLSSGVNVRIVKAEMEGSEVHNLFRMQQYLAKEAKDDNASSKTTTPRQTKPKRKRAKQELIKSAIQSLNLTPHGKLRSVYYLPLTRCFFYPENILLTVLINLQEELSTQLYAGSATSIQSKGVYMYEAHACRARKHWEGHLRRLNPERRFFRYLALGNTSRSTGCRLLLSQVERLANLSSSEKPHVAETMKRRRRHASCRLRTSVWAV